MFKSEKIQTSDSSDAEILPRFRFISASRITRPLMEQLEPRYFFAAPHVASASAMVALPAPPPVPELFISSALPAPTTPVANVIGQVEAPVPSPITEQGDLSALLENDTGFTLMGNSTNDTMFTPEGTR